MAATETPTDSNFAKTDHVPSVHTLPFSSSLTSKLQSLKHHFDDFFAAACCHNPEVEVPATLALEALPSGRVPQTEGAEDGGRSVDYQSLPPPQEVMASVGQTPEIASKSAVFKTFVSYFSKLNVRRHLIEFSNFLKFSPIKLGRRSGSFSIATAPTK